MSATFMDMQDDHNGSNGSLIADAPGLGALLDSFKGREPFSFLLVGDGGFTLTVGWRPDVMSVQFGPSGGTPPYHMARFGEESEGEGTVEFLSSGTPTPIRRHFCLPTDTARKVILDFLANGRQSGAVGWEEI
jgi:hypothetical protein